MDYRLDIGMWNQVFAVPCALVDQHIKLAGRSSFRYCSMPFATRARASRRRGWQATWA